MFCRFFSQGWLFVLLFLFIGLAVRAQEELKPLTHNFVNVTFDEFFDYIQKNTSLIGIYSSSLTKDLPRINYKADKVPVKKILDTVLGRVGLECNIDGNVFRLLKKMADSTSVPPVLKGKIIGEDGEPINGASVLNVSTNKYFVTSVKGLFELLWPAGSVYVNCTGVSYESKTVKVSPMGFITIVMKRSHSILDEVVVMAYHKVTRRNNTSAVDHIEGSELQCAGINITKALQGKVAGVSIVGSGGTPGSSVKVQIRGQQSIGAIPGVGNLPQNDPYMLLNKVPIIMGNKPVTRLSSAAGDPQDGGSAVGGISAQEAINPKDIESVDVLKDADATAIYGSKGANGAILYTTRKGKKGKPRFNISTEKGLVFTTYQHSMLDSLQYVTMRREALKDVDKQPDIINAPDLHLPKNYSYKNIPKLLTGGRGESINVNLSLSGGNSEWRYYLNGGWYQETSILPTKLTQKRFVVNGSLQYHSKDSSFRSDLFANQSILEYNSLAHDPMFSVNVMPILPALSDENGVLNWGEDGFRIVNPLGQMHNTHHTEIKQFTIGWQLEYRLWKHWSFRANLGYQQLPVKETQRIPVISKDSRMSPEGEWSSANGHNKGVIVEPQLNFFQTWGGLMLNWHTGVSWQAENNRSEIFRGTGYKNDLVLGLPGEARQSSTSNEKEKYKYLGGYSRVNLEYRSKYMLNLTGRIDASSRFGDKRKRAFFGAGGAAWIITEEKWMKKWESLLTYGKLRANYGTTGSDNIGNYQYLETWAPIDGVRPYDGKKALQPNRLANPMLGWELSQKAELGGEFEFIDCIFLGISWYRNITSNQVVSVEIPDQAGPPGTMMINSPAKVRNTGWEVMVRTSFRWARKNSWTSSLQFSLPRNRLMSFPGIGSTTYNSTLLVGYPLSVQQGYPYLGVDPGTGLFKVPPGSVPGMAFPAKIIVAGHREPTLMGGWYNEWKLGAIRASILVDARRQMAPNPLFDVYNNTQPGKKWNPAQYTNQPSIVWQRWQQPGDNTIIPKFTAATTNTVNMTYDYFNQSVDQLISASFWRIRTVYLAWDLPVTWMKWLRLKEARIYLQGQNLLTFSSYHGGDPTSQFPLRFPSLRTIVSGLQIDL